MRILLAIMLLLSESACAEQHFISSPCIIQIGKAKWQMEIAKTEEEREKGLMFRKAMPENDGMVFMFETPHKVDMWMKNTLIPLDMLFVGQNLAIAHIEEETKPLSEDIISSKEIVTYVLELNAGQAEKNGIKIGDLLNLSQCPALSGAKN